MIKEIIIPYEGKVNEEKLRVVPLDKEEVTSDKTDTFHSLKIVDDDGQIVLLIETAAEDMLSKDGERCERGCYIHRFEIAERMINTDFLLNTLGHLYARITFAMYYDEEKDKFLSTYHYVWTEEVTDVQCVIAEILGLKEVYHNKKSTVYRRDWSLE